MTHIDVNEIDKILMKREILTHFLISLSSDHPEYKKCLHMDVFGCEDLLVELARKDLKVQLSPVQRILLNQTGYGHLFEFDGKPDVTVYARLPKNRSCTKSQYKK